MTVFAITTPPDNPRLPEFVNALDRVFERNHIFVAQGQYLAARRNFTSAQVAEAMGAHGELGQFLVVTSGGWNGWHQSAIWEWLRLQDQNP